MRVTHLLPSVGTGGAEAVAATLHELGVARGVDSALHPRLAHEGRAPWSAWLRWSLDVRAEGRVVHAHLPWPDRLGAALLAARGRPLVVTFHLLPRGDWPRDRLLGLDARRVLRLAASRPGTRWIALSRNDVAALAEHGVRAEVVRNAPPAPTPSDDPVVFPEGALRVASVGRLDPQKGFDQMLDSAVDPAKAPLALGHRGGRPRAGRARGAARPAGAE
ncbi:MAG: glycosyltransferase [Polyangiales bacterium]